jgi:uncharacterized FlaG/YvyC family protein
MVKKLSKSCPKVVQKLLKSCQKVVKKLSKSCQKSCQKVSESCQKVIKKLQKVAKSLQKVTYGNAMHVSLIIVCVMGSHLQNSTKAVGWVGGVGK